MNTDTKVYKEHFEVINISGYFYRLNRSKNIKAFVKSWGG